MIWSKSLWFGCMLALYTALLALAGCDGSDGAPGPQGPAGTPGTASTATQLNFMIDSITIASPPVVNFTVTNESGVGFTGLTDTDLRFNIAKLTPGTNGNPSNWQNYIVTGGSAMHGSQERLHSPARDSDVWGELVDHNDGTYTYTFATDITSVTCPAPCTEADGTPLDLSYNANLTHRLTIQQGNSSLPTANMECDFVPASGTTCVEPDSGTIDSREIVKTDNCNECHDKITAHGSRFETRLCVTCHNPGSWADADTTVDFRVMIHKIHRGENLPSGSYAIGSHDFSDVVFPQDIRNCTKCHDGSDPETPQGNNWQIPNMAACGSCHEDIDFSKDGAVDPAGHSGGIVSDNSVCITCHAEGKYAGSVAESHTVPGKAERDYFTFKILEICGTAVDMNPVCPPDGTTPVTMKFAVIDENSGVPHAYSTATPGNAYSVDGTTGDPEFTSSKASLNMLTAWDTRDYTNADGGQSGSSLPARAVYVDLRATAVDGTDGTFTVTGSPIPVTATGSGTVAIEGHPATHDGATSVAANSVVAYFGITDTTPVPRRTVVDVPTKCDRCHDSLDVHGNNRNNNGQLCVMCHNPSNTDVSRRPKTGGIPDASGLDGKKAESIDFKRLIHGIHSASVEHYDGTEAHGFRTHGIVVYGYNSTPNDFSDVRFPGVLSKCRTCHLEKGEVDSFGNTAKYDTYTLEDHTADGGVNWEYPSLSGIKGSTVDSVPTATNSTEFDTQVADQSDDYKYSPISSVCSACHDGELEMAHMAQNGGILGGPNSEQSVQENNLEGCPVCHGAGKLVDVEFVHDQAFENFIGEVTQSN